MGPGERTGAGALSQRRVWAGFISKDYTPRMNRVTGLVALLAALAFHGCIATDVVFHVARDGHGRAVNNRMDGPEIQGGKKSRGSNG